MSRSNEIYVSLADSLFWFLLNIGSSKFVLDSRTFLKRRSVVMAPPIVKWGGRAVFFALLATQCGFLTAYPVEYKDNPAWCAVFLSYVPAILLWICFMYVYRDKAGLRPFFGVWAAYVFFALLPNIIVIFGFVVNSLDKEKFLGPNVLKMVLCITPVLLILLLNTADYGDEDYDEKKVRRELVSRLSVQMAIDLLDTIEILDIVLEEKEHDQEHDYDRISNGFGIAMIVVACLSFLMSLFQMAEIKFDSDGKPDKLRYKTTLIRTAGEMIAVNVVFLIIRLVVFFKYGKDESIFIAKNGIAIVLSSLEICYLVDSHQ